MASIFRECVLFMISMTTKYKKRNILIPVLHTINNH